MLAQAILLSAHLIESNADDALPIYRQRDQLSRLGFDLPLNTLYGYWTHGTDMLGPVAAVTLSTLLGDDVVNLDDTKLKVLIRNTPRPLPGASAVLHRHERAGRIHFHPDLAGPGNRTFCRGHRGLHPMRRLQGLQQQDPRS